MSVSANLIDEYQSRLMADDVVRHLSANVVQDAQSETIDVVASHNSIRQAARDASLLVKSNSDVGTARRSIMGWLNKVFFTDLEVTLDDRWWWEMHSRLEKLLIISMVLEGDNLRSFLATPEATDIPQALIYISQRIQRLRKTSFPDLEREYVAR